MWFVLIYILCVLVIVLSIKTYPISISKYGSLFYDPSDYIIAAELKNNKVYEEDFIVNDLFPIIYNCSVILDLGANIGSHCIAYASHNKNCKIYAFEPQKELYEILKNNIRINNLNTRIIPINKAVGDREGKLKLQKVPYGEDFNKGGVGFGNDGEEIEVITIDSLNLEKCDYIKMDIQGAEPLAIIGGEKTIKKFKPKIMFESDGSFINPEDVGTDKIPDAKDLLISYGYTFKELISNNFLATYK